MAFKPTLSLDFDGVIHDYHEGFKDGTIYGDVVPGFFEWAERAAKVFTLVIYSSRSDSEEGTDRMRCWLHARAIAHYGAYGPAEGFMDLFTFATTKPKAWVTIDDRCVTFTGRWEDPDLDPARLRAFRPWNSIK